jgi:uncharacterized protein DUF6152
LNGNWQDRGGHRRNDPRPLKLTGTLTTVEWTDPHIWYYIDVKNPDGATTAWGLSGGAPGQLTRRRKRFAPFKPGGEPFYEPRTGDPRHDEPTTVVREGSAAREVNESLE